MVKLFILWLTIIILLTGCTQEYKLERMYYFANKDYTRIAKNPSKIEPTQIVQSIKKFEEIIKTNPNWGGIKNVRYSEAHLYFLKKDFKKARGKFTKITQDFPYQIDICLQARFFIGLSYEYEDKWDKALAVFEKIMKEYPLTPMSIQLPHYIAQYYENHKKYEQANEILKNAVTNYKKIINDYPYEKNLIIVMEDMVLQTYEKLEDWEGVLSTLQQMSVKYHKTDKGAQSLYRMAKIYESRKEIKQAISLYHQFIKEYPEHKLANTAKTKIHALELALPTS